MHFVQKKSVSSVKEGGLVKEISAINKASVLHCDNRKDNIEDFTGIIQIPLKANIW